jgi:hypothetical protein
MFRNKRTSRSRIYFFKYRVVQDLKVHGIRSISIPIGFFLPNLEYAGPDFYAAPRTEYGMLLRNSAWNFSRQSESKCTICIEVVIFSSVETCLHVYMAKNGRGDREFTTPFWEGSVVTCKHSTSTWACLLLFSLVYHGGK